MRKWLISQFPEALFKPNLNKEDYYGRVMHGRDIMSNSAVLFCMLARNVETEIEYTIARIEHLGSMFRSYRVIVYENDSTDSTREILLKWREENSSVELILEDLRKKRHEQDYSLARTTDMAYYRNQYLQKARSHSFYDCNYVIILDSDLPGGFSYFGVCNSLSYDKDVMASNGVLYRERDGITEKLFYDTFAFRPLNRESIKDYSIYNLLDYRVGQEPIKVFSAFGGLCIYKTDVLGGNNLYQSHDCDHPTLHKQLREVGYEVFLNPSQLTLYNEHEYVSNTRSLTDGAGLN